MEAGDDRQRRQPDDLDPALVEARDARQARLDRFSSAQRERDLAAARGTIVTVPGNSTGNARFADVASTTVAMPEAWMPYMRPFNEAQVAAAVEDNPGARLVRGQQQRLRAQYPTEPRGSTGKSGGRKRQ